MVSKFGKTSGHVGTKGLKSWRNKPATSYLQLLYQVMAPSSHLHWQTKTNSSRWCLQVVHLPMISCFNNKFASRLKTHFDERGCRVCYAPRSVHRAIATSVRHKVSIVWNAIPRPISIHRWFSWGLDFPIWSEVYVFT